ncbi:MAG: pyridoxamine 5'-phosphate oxidase family protein [Candidatus Hodarchaeales archaeon]
MKLGSMQPLKKYTFLQEQIFEGVWPFNKVKSPTNVFLLLLLYFFWGLALVVIYQIPMPYIIAGSCSAFGLFLWTTGIFLYADRLRNVEIEKINRVNKKFLVGFLENIFHPSSIVIAVITYTIVLTYFFTSTSFGLENFLTYMQKELNVLVIPPFLLGFVLLLTFDISYRLSLSLYIILMQIRRNFHLRRLLKTPMIKTHFSPNDVKNLEKADYIHYLAISGGFALIPLGLMDRMILLALSLYLISTFTLSTINILHLRLLYVRSIPDGMLNLIKISKFAQVGTISPGKIPHVTPTLFVFDGRNFFIATSTKSKKVKNLMRSKNISLFIDPKKHEDLTKSVGILVKGKSKIYGHNIISGIIFFLLFGYRMARIYYLFQRKYPHHIDQYLKINRYLPRAWQIFPILSRTIVQITPEKIFLWKASRSDLMKL